MVGAALGALVVLLVLALVAGLVARQGWRLMKLVHEGVATTGTVTSKLGRGHGRSVLRYEYQGPDGARHEGACPVDATTWSAHEVGSPIGVVYVASRRGSAASAPRSTRRGRSRVSRPCSQGARPSGPGRMSVTSETPGAQ